MVACMTMKTLMIGYILLRFNQTNNENVSDCPIATSDEDTGIGTTYFETEKEAIETWNRRMV